MTNILKPPFALAAAILSLGALISALATTPGFARGGGDIMNSPGYQRALQAEHKAYLRAFVEPVVVVTPSYRMHRLRDRRRH